MRGMGKLVDGGRMPDNEQTLERYRFCTTCGTESVGDVSFCGGCGYSLGKPGVMRSDAPPLSGVAQAEIRLQEQDGKERNSSSRSQGFSKLICSECQTPGIRYDGDEWADRLHDDSGNLVLTVSNFSDALICLPCENSFDIDDFVCSQCGDDGHYFEGPQWNDERYDKSGSLVLTQSKHFEELTCFECETDLDNGAERASIEVARTTRRLHWRKMTWVILTFNLMMVIWLVTSLTASTKDCNGLTAGQCAGVADVAHSAVAAIQIVLWVVGDIILGILWLVTKGRSCPACGRSVKRGLLVCKGCGHDFRANALAKG
jgi:hypothetical protein